MCSITLSYLLTYLLSGFGLGLENADLEPILIFTNKYENIIAHSCFRRQQGYHTLPF